jgi:hypothetical protein
MSNFTTTLLSNLSTNTTVTLGKYSSIASANDSVEQVPSGNLILTANTGNVIISTGATDSSKLTINNSGSVIQSFPVHLALYGIPTYYNAAGTSQGQTTPAANNWYYTLPPTTSSSTTNWTPSITLGSRLAIPYSGLYALSMSYTNLSNSSLECFISKNLGNGADIVSNDDRLLCLVQSATGAETSLTTTANLLSTDYVSFGFYLATGTVNQGNRATLRATLLQRTS